MISCPPSPTPGPTTACVEPTIGSKAAKLHCCKRAAPWTPPIGGHPLENRLRRSTNARGAPAVSLDQVFPQSIATQTCLAEGAPPFGAGSQSVSSVSTNRFGHSWPTRSHSFASPDRSTARPLPKEKYEIAERFFRSLAEKAVRTRRSAGPRKRAGEARRQIHRPRARVLATSRPSSRCRTWCKRAPSGRDREAKSERFHGRA